MNKWDVFLHGQWIDRVYFDSDMSAQRVSDSLIDRDGYSEFIVLRRGR